MDRRVIDAAVDAAIEEAMLRDMVWGRDDCSLWVCNAVVSAGGPDFAAALRGYDSAAGAARALKAHAGGGLKEAAVKIAGEFSLKEARRPFRGDLIGMVMSPHRPSLALFWQGGWIARSERGIVRLPADAGLIAWRWA